MELALNIAIFSQTINFSHLKAKLLSLGIKNIELPIQLWMSKDNIEKEEISDFQVVSLSGLLHQNLIFPQSIFVEEEEFKRQLSKLDAKLEAAKKLNCKFFALGIDPYTSLNITEARTLFCSRVKYLAKILDDYGFILNLEYINHKVSGINVNSNLFCASLEFACELINQVNANNIKLLLDLIHYYGDGEKVSFRNIQDMIGFVHVCDHKDNVDHLSDMYRVLPFEGNLPVKNFMQNLKTINYNGYISVEVFFNKFYKPTLSEIKKSIFKVQDCYLT